MAASSADTFRVYSSAWLGKKQINEQINTNTSTYLLSLSTFTSPFDSWETNAVAYKLWNDSTIRRKPLQMSWKTKDPGTSGWAAYLFNTHTLILPGMLWINSKLMPKFIISNDCLKVPTHLFGCLLRDVQLPELLQELRVDILASSAGLNWWIHPAVTTTTTLIYDSSGNQLRRSGLVFSANPNPSALTPNGVSKCGPDATHLMSLWFPLLTCLNTEHN